MASRREILRVAREVVKNARPSDWNLVSCALEGYLTRCGAKLTVSPPSFFDDPWRLWVKMGEVTYGPFRLRPWSPVRRHFMKGIIQRNKEMDRPIREFWSGLPKG